VKRKALIGLYKVAMDDKHCKTHRNRNKPSDSTIAGPSPSTHRFSPSAWEKNTEKNRSVAALLLVERQRPEVMLLGSVVKSIIKDSFHTVW